MRVGRGYELRQCVGQGATGWVYRARREGLAAPVVVKLAVPRSPPADSPAPPDRRLERFARGARLLQRVQHPHVIDLFELGFTRAGLFFTVAEYLGGGTLRHWLEAAAAEQPAGARRPPLARSEGLAVLWQLLLALQASHRVGLVHRDVKPENVMLVEPGARGVHAKLVDFALARPASGEGAAVTAPGEICGSPAYMAPEQIRGGDVSPATDLYSLGILLHELLTGQRPFGEADVAELLTLQLSTPVPPLSSEKTGPRFTADQEWVAARAVAKEPDDRFGSAQEMRAAFEAAFFPEKGVPGRDRRDRIEPRVGTRVSPGFAATSAAVTSAETMSGPPSSQPVNGEGDGGSTRSWREVKATGVSSKQERSGSPQTMPRSRFPAVAKAPHPPLRRAPLRAARLRAIERSRRGSREPQRARAFSAAADTQEAAFPPATVDLEALRSFLYGPGRVLSLEGAPGSGRQALLQAAVALAGRRGCEVLRAGPDPWPAPRPLQPLQLLVSQATGFEGRAEDPAALPRLLAGLGLPAADAAGLRLLFDLRTPAVELPLDAQARELAAAVGRILASAPRARLIVVEDTAALDSASRWLLRELAQRLQGRSTRLLVSGSAPVIPAGPGVQRLRPHRLPTSTVEREARRALGDPPGAAALAAEIARRSDGRGAAAAVLVALARTGELPAQDDPVERRRILAGRTSADARRLLLRLAFLGGRAPRALLRALWGPGAAPARALASLTSAGLVATDAVGTLRLRYPPLAARLRDTLDEPTRADWSARAHRHLRRQGVEATTLAPFVDGAPRPELGVEILEQAAARCRRRFDPEGAFDHLQRARRINRWQRLLPDAHPAQLRLAWRAAGALRAAEHEPVAQMLLRSARAGSEAQPGWSARLDAALAESLALDPASAKEALSRVDQALGAALASHDAEVLLQVGAVRVGLLRRMGRAREARDALEELLGHPTVLEGAEGPPRQGAEGAEGPEPLADPASPSDPVVTLLWLGVEIYQALGWEAQVVELLGQINRRGQRAGRRAEVARARLREAEILQSEHRSLVPAALDALALYDELGDRLNAARAARLLALADRGSRLRHARALQDRAREIGWHAGLLCADELLSASG
jgi:serine/threonine protein kinase